MTKGKLAREAEDRTSDQAPVRQRDSAEDLFGFVNIDKPTGWTSHDVVAKVRSVLRTKKVGHTGTLDPLATGVLVVCVGPATRLARFLPEERKTYRACLALGVSTDTQDSQGRVVDERPAEVSSDEIREAIRSLTGRIRQRPPMASAVKVRGRALYKWARQGVAMAAPERTVTIETLDVEKFNGGPRPELTIRVCCSKGTYVRTLGHDLGERLGCGAHLTELRRLASGDFSVEEATTIEALEKLAARDRIQEVFITPEAALAHYPSLTVKDEAVRLILNGVRLEEPMVESVTGRAEPGSLARLLDGTGRLLAMTLLGGELGGEPSSLGGKSVWVRPNA